VHSCRRTHRFAPCEREILTSHVVSQEDSVATSSEYDCPANDSPRVILLSAPFGALLFQTHWLPTFESQCLCGLYSFATSSTSTIQKTNCLVLDRIDGTYANKGRLAVPCSIRCGVGVFGPVCREFGSQKESLEMSAAIYTGLSKVAPPWLSN
jgi:hypothetical protein